MEGTTKFKRHEKYNDFFLPTVSSFIAAHLVVCYQKPENPFEVITTEGYLLAVGNSFIIALMIFAAINVVNWLLDVYYSWESAKWKRLWLQLIVGVFGVMALDVVASAMYFLAEGHQISDTIYFDVYFFQIFSYISLINLYYNSEPVTNWKILNKELKVDQAELSVEEDAPIVPRTDEKHTEEINEEPELMLKAALLNYISLHDVVLIYTDNDDVFAKTTSGEKMGWNFRIATTIKGLDLRLYFKANRSQIVRRDAIMRIHLKPKKRCLTLYLKEPYNEEIRVAKSGIERFTSWWYRKEQ